MIFIVILQPNYHSVVNKISLVYFISMGTQACYRRFEELD
jgi:hypothetical protein